MSFLDQALEALLYEHECVVVPQLGAFLVYRESAVIDHVQGLIHPPSKNVRFNAALSEDEDQLLVRHVARREGLTLEQAQGHVAHAVGLLLQALAQQQTVLLARVGKLYQDVEGKVRFVSEGVNFDQKTYGLPVLRFYPILRQPAADRYVPSSPQAMKPAFANPLARLPRPSVLAAALLLLLGVPAMIWFLRNNDNGSRGAGPANQEAAFVPDSGDSEKASAKGEKGDKEKSQQAAILPQQGQGDVPLDMQLADDADDDNADPVKDKKKDFSEKENRDMTARYLDETEASGAWVIMVGSFGQSENAARLSKALLAEGYTPFTDLQNGLRRVGVRLNCSQSDLQKHLAAIRKKHNKGAWVLDK